MHAHAHAHAHVHEHEHAHAHAHAHEPTAAAAAAAVPAVQKKRHALMTLSHRHRLALNTFCGRYSNTILSSFTQAFGLLTKRLMHMLLKRACPLSKHLLFLSKRPFSLSISLSLFFVLLWHSSGQFCEYPCANRHVRTGMLEKVLR